MISSRFESGSVPERVLRPDAPVAQLDRAPGFEPVGRGFKSLRARQTLVGGTSSPPAPLARSLAARFDARLRSRGLVRCARERKKRQGRSLTFEILSLKFLRAPARRRARP